jgi:hypothetical protein
MAAMEMMGMEEQTRARAVKELGVGQAAMEALLVVALLLLVLAETTVALAALERLMGEMEGMEVPAAAVAAAGIIEPAAVVVAVAVTRGDLLVTSDMAAQVHREKQVHPLTSHTI